MMGHNKRGRDEGGQATARGQAMPTFGVTANHLDLILKCDGRINRSISIYSWTKGRDKLGIVESLGWDLAYQVKSIT